MEKSFFGIIFFKGNNSVTSNKISPVSADNDEITIGQLITDQFDKATLEAFLTVQFTHHYEILSLQCSLPIIMRYLDDQSQLMNVFFI